MTEVFPIPLNALRAIEIVSRTRALGPAAEELGVTPGAVSQHIRRAEERLGLVLFERRPDGLHPTEALLAVQPRLRSGFQALSDAVTHLSAAPGNVLTVTLGNVFASRWLIWRLGRFQAVVPNIELRIVTGGQLLDLARPDLDCAIRFGKGDWPDTRCQLLGGCTYFPAAAPDLANRLNSPADLAHVPVIKDPAGMLSWADWLAGAGAVAPPELKGPAYSDPSLAFDAAIAGQGVLLMIDIMASDGLKAGRLAEPFGYRHEGGDSYWFVTHESKSLTPRVRQFFDWMKSEMATG